MIQPENKNTTKFVKMGETEMIYVGGICLTETHEDKSREGSDRWEQFHGNEETEFNKEQS